MSRLLTLLSRHSHPTISAQYLSPSVLRIVQSKQHLIEIKNTLNHKQKSFQLENWHHSKELCVGRWLPSISESYQMPIGSYSWGVWRKQLNIGAYRIHDHHGNLVAYRIDILKDVVMNKSTSNDIIQFSDLVVDLWLWPNDKGEVTQSDVFVEDIEQLIELKACGLVSDCDSQLIDEVLCDVKSHPQRYVDLVDASIQEAVGGVEKLIYGIP
jgi:hypothetical protein